MPIVTHVRARRSFQILFITLGLLPLRLWAQVPEPEDLPQAAFSAGPEQPIPVEPPRVVTGEFDNGLHYYIRENHEPANRAELRLIVNAGSVLEDEDQRGLAHFLEHMAFNGSAHFARQELVEFMESIGMQLGPDINASTSFDETIYQLQVPTDDPAFLDTAFLILQDWSDALTLEDSQIEQERGVVIEEWRQGRGAQARIRDRQLPVLLQDSRYAERLPIGTLENLETFEHEALRRFYEDWYRPDLMAVVAVGDFEADDIERLIREHFSDLPASADPRERSRFVVPAQEDTAYTITTDPEVPVTQISLYHHYPTEHDWTVGGYRQKLVEQLYNMLLNNRLQEMAREADAPFLAASSANTPLVRPLSSHVLSAAVAEGEFEQGLAALLVESERVTRFGFTESELARQKSTLLRAWEQQFNNRQSRASASHAAELTRAYLTGESVPGAEWEYALTTRFVPEITLEEINRVGADWMDNSSRVVAATAPETEDQKVPTAGDLAAVIDATGTSEITAYEETTSADGLVNSIPPGSPVIENHELPGGLTEWMLGNGVRVLVKPTAFRADEILFSGVRPGGTSVASDENFVPASTAITLIANSGVGDFSGVELQRQLSGKAANVVPVISEFEEGLNGNGSPEDLETLMQLIYLRMTAPRADPDFYQVFHNQIGAVLRNRDANPDTAFEDTFQRLLFQDHPRRQPPTVKILEDTDLDGSLDFYEQRFGDASGFTFVFIGSLDPDTLQPLVETWLGALPASGREQDWHDHDIRNPDGIVEETLYRGQEDQSRTRISFNGEFEVRDNLDRSRLVAVSRLLQARLRDIIREELGGSYNVQVIPRMNWLPVDSYNLIIEFASDPRRAEELSGIVFDEVERAKEGLATEAEFEEIRQYFLRSYETGLEQNGFWMSQLTQALSMGVTDSPARPILEQPEVVEALSPESLRDMARQLLDEERYIHLTLMPEA